MSRVLAAISIALLISATAHAQAPQAARVTKAPLTAQQRYRIAQRATMSWLKGMDADKTSDIKMHRSLEDDTGGDYHPITGHGATSLYVYQFPKGSHGVSTWQRLFDSRYRQKLTFLVDDKGEAHELDRHSLAVQKRLGRAFANVVGGLAADALNSNGATSGLVGVTALSTLLATSGGDVAAAHPAVAAAGIAAVVKLAGDVTAGVGRVRQARTKALTDTVAWAKAEAGANHGEHPSFTDAWNFYSAKLGEQRLGTPVGTKLDFMKALRSAGL